MRVFIRFVRWFSYHLSNYQFRWSWDDWVDVTSMDLLHPKAVFVRESLASSLRLTYHKRIAELVPKPLASFVPPDPVPQFRFMQDGAESLPLYGYFQELFASIRQKCPPQETLEILAKVRHRIKKYGKKEEWSHFAP
jgi:nuclear cap-binding protein subunit 1